MSSIKPFYVRFAARKQQADVQCIWRHRLLQRKSENFRTITFALGSRDEQWPTDRNTIFVTSQISTRLRRSRQQVSNPVSLLSMVGAIAFANFGKEARETSVQFFSFVFDNVIVEALSFCPEVLTVFLFTAFLASFCISSPEISGIFFFAAQNINKNVIVSRVVMVTLLYHPFLMLHFVFAAASEPEAKERGSSLISRRLHYRGLQLLFLTKRK